MSKRDRIITAVAIAVCVVILGIVSVFAFSGNSEGQAAAEPQIELIDEETGEYMLMNVPCNYSFQINAAEGAQSSDDSTGSEDDGSPDGDSFAVYDLNGQKAETSLESDGNHLTIAAPEGGYEAGELYTIDLRGSGSFENKGLEKAKKLLFCTRRKGKDTVEFTDRVKEVKSDEVKIDGENIVVDGKFESGDIIQCDIDGDETSEFFKLRNAHARGSETVARVAEPTGEEIYENIDIFYYGNVNVSDVELDEEAMEAALEDAGIFDIFFDKAYAAGKKELNYELKDGEGYTKECIIKDPENPDRQLKITFGIKDKLLIKIDDDKVAVDNRLTLSDGLEFSVKGEDSKKMEAEIRSAWSDYESSGSKGDKNREKIAICTVSPPLAKPIRKVVKAEIQVGITAEYEYSAKFNAGVDAEVVLKQGIIYSRDKKEIIKKYGEIDGGLDAHLFAEGKFNAFAGAYIGVECGVCGIIDADLVATGGPYLDAEGCFTVKGIPANPTAEGVYRLELGILLKADFTIDTLFTDKKSYSIARKKRPLWQKSQFRKLQGVDIKDEYVKYSGSIYIGSLTATYDNILSGKTEQSSIGDYDIFLDDKEVSLNGGLIKLEGDLIDGIPEGAHTLKIQWKEDGESFEYEKDIEVTARKYDFAFAEQMILGRTKEEIEENVGTDLRLVDEYTVGTLCEWYEIEGIPLKAGYYLDVVGFSDKCIIVSGTAEQLFGVKEDVGIEEFCNRNNIEYEKNDYALEEDYDSFISRHGFWFGTERNELLTDKINYAHHNIIYTGLPMKFNGINYLITILCNNHIVEPESMCGIEFYIPQNQCLIY